MSRFHYFSEMKNIVKNSEDISTDEALLRVEAMKQLNDRYALKTDRMQRILDWLAQPVPIPSRDYSEEQAAIDVILMKGYWEAIASRNSKSQPNIHQHIHLHSYDISPERKQLIMNGHFK